MSALANIEQLESDLWNAAYSLRVNSKLTAGEYCMPVLSVIILRHATNLYREALPDIQKNEAMGTLLLKLMSSESCVKRAERLREAKA